MPTCNVSVFAALLYREAKITWVEHEKVAPGAAKCWEEQGGTRPGATC